MIFFSQNVHYVEKQFKQAHDPSIVQLMQPIIYDNRDHEIQTYNNIHTTIGDEISLSYIFRKMLTHYKVLVLIDILC